MTPYGVAEDWQDDDLVRECLRSHSQMKSLRAPWESIYRQVERRVDPVQAGGFDQLSPGGQRGLDMFDSTAAEGLERYEAAIGGLMYPRNQRYHGLITTSGELNKLPEVQAWCQYATDRLFAMRYAPAAGFETQIYEDIRSGGLYGVSPLWVDEVVGYSLFYKSIHLSEIYIDENYCGRVDTVHREFEKTARQIKQQFPNSLSPKMMEALAPGGKPETKFRILHCIRPASDYDATRLDYRGKPIESLTIAMDEKWILRRSGYFTMPLIVSRTSTSPRDIYGRSPAMRVLGTIKGLNEMAKTMLRAAHRAVDPPILFHDDGQMTKFSSKPGGLNPGMVDEMGRQLAHPMQSGGQLQIGMEMQNNERDVVKNAFLDKFFSLLMERGDRLTATEAMEITRQSGMLVAPTAGRMETEKSGPTIERELDIGLRSGQILPPPAVMREAMGSRQAGLKVIYNNPLSRMARADEAAGFARWSEMLTGLAQYDEEIIDLVDVDETGRGLADVLGVRPTWIATPDKIAAKRAARAEAKQQESLIAGAPAATQSALNLAKAQQIGAAA
jgi:hypothetical protein